MFTIYEAQRNTDRTEGRGSMRTFATFTNEAQAVKAVKGEGVMGVGDGEVEKVTFSFAKDGTVDIIREKVYGYHKTGAVWRYGYVDDRDFVADPEWAEYVRLKNKFGG